MKCTDKIAYNTRREAYDIAKNIRRHGATERTSKKMNRKKVRLQVYECPFCGKYHISHYKITMKPPRNKNQFGGLIE